ncbi:hypothetical protein OG585_54170 (plasmid) [Streptomyces sp. NBC_01340]|uniref:hypothetical protein n=1 Tax=unclassified Streptomyces TaxID=2593676 RepID=UPI0022548CA1|nr:MULTISPECIES: hypothetical protein [unclassified Streptomyces]MCX4461798.1 hypothetical protein [Streptomyces sp. NBC_01719]MCX4490707.1 hypothetical protein [Streptomyces sp. NBC_01728]WSI45678.1 hypothetical protein OG585_54170 [Streptomyces sp. NBC_01340]
MARVLGSGVWCAVEPGGEGEARSGEGSCFGGRVEEAEGEVDGMGPPFGEMGGLSWAGASVAGVDGGSPSNQAAT